MADPTNDLDILDNLQAADQNTPTPAQDDPLQHVPEEALRNLDTLQVDLPQVQEQANLANTIATEAAALKKRGLIHSLEAEQLSTLVPAIQGSKEDPLSYTSVPTAVGVSHAVELMEREAVAAQSMAVVKGMEAIDRVVVRADAFLSKFEGEWVAAIATYQASIENVKSARGSTPESDPNAYIGNEPAVQVLRRLAKDDAQLDDLPPHLGALHQVINQANNHTSRLEMLTYAQCLAIGDTHYSITTLVKGLFTTMDSGDVMTAKTRTPSYTSVLTGPTTQYPDTVMALQTAARAMVERLRTAATHLQQAKTQAASVQETTHAINDATLAAALFEHIEKAMQMLLELTQAAATFYEACAQSGLVQVAKEKQTFTPSRVQRKFF